MSLWCYMNAIYTSIYMGIFSRLLLIPFHMWTQHYKRLKEIRHFAIRSATLLDKEVKQNTYIDIVHTYIRVCLYGMPSTQLNQEQLHCILLRKSHLVPNINFPYSWRNWILPLMEGQAFVIIIWQFPKDNPAFPSSLGLDEYPGEYESHSCLSFDL